MRPVLVRMIRHRWVRFHPANDGVARINAALSAEVGNLAFRGGRVYATGLWEDKTSQRQA